ncbi:MAG: hypothetical protein IT450_05310 [Phycisphaerales bacterium]|nr:hypothetical protein [Phycisphaerales bacterium]
MIRIPLRHSRRNPPLWERIRLGRSRGGNRADGFLSQGAGRVRQPGGSIEDTHSAARKGDLIVKTMTPALVSRRWAWVVVLAGALLGTGGCPIDSDEVVTESVRAALEAIVSSFVESLGDYLATN